MQYGDYFNTTVNINEKSRAFAAYNPLGYITAFSNELISERLPVSVMNVRVTLRLLLSLARMGLYAKGLASSIAFLETQSYFKNY